jgi:hypothetical protein
MAHSGQSLNDFFSEWPYIEELKPGIIASLPVDWNIVLQRINAHFDDLDGGLELQPPKLTGLGNLFIGVRSRRAADCMAWMLCPPGQAFREAHRRTICADNLHRITLAMLVYHYEHGRLPPAYTVDADGNPLHSWRVLLLPYLGQQALSGKLRLDEPWDSEHNRRFHGAVPAVYQCPSATHKPGQTTYSVVVGQNTAFAAGKGKSLDDLGMNLILVVEREQSTGRDAERQSVCWMAPTLELGESIAFKGFSRPEEHIDGIGSRHPGGMNVGLRDGSVQFIAETIELLSLQGLLDGTAEERRY